jgi:DNA replication and repair protein RecF
MHLASLSATNFKNYREINIQLSPGLNLFTGPNGSGKTNLLDGVYILCLTKSAFQSNDNQNILFGESFFSLIGKFSRDGKNEQIIAALEKGNKKIIKADKKPYDKISDHIGKYPAVLITPYDTDIVREGSEERRKFFDALISQINHEYLTELMKYTNALKQRNALLKQFAEQRNTDLDLLSTYDSQLLRSGKKIFDIRQVVSREYIPIFENQYNLLSGNKEKVELVYESDFSRENFSEFFLQARSRDLLLQRTTVGIHKDDFIFSINGNSLKSFGSQGQQKSFVISMKLAQSEVIRVKAGIKPILLLDDIFDKLDQDRINRLLKIISGENYGQIFVTEARSDRAEIFFNNYPGEIRKFSILDGMVEIIS